MLTTELNNSSFREWQNEPAILPCGMLIICRSGEATINVNFHDWQLKPGAVITLFPNDGVKMCASFDFDAEYLSYSADLLRESSLSIESTVYTALRNDRCRTDSTEITKIVNAMFTLLHCYKELSTVDSFRQIVMLQLRVFFLGFYDYIQQHPQLQPDTIGSRRVHELFSQFMYLLEHNYEVHHDVAFYANQLNITTKYLNNIVQSITQLSTKEIIDNYIIMQLKLLLRSTNLSISEIAWKYKFSTLSFFTHYFKQHTGFTPKQYKNASK